MRSVIVFISFFWIMFCSGIMLGQEVTDDCTNPKEVIIPLVSDSLEEEIYYKTEDNYTFWYKVKVEESGKLNYAFSPLNNSDSYEILSYQYFGKNFCSDLINRKVKVISKKQNFSIGVKKGETYYLSVLHLKGKGCGHELTIKSSSKKITYKAIQNECFEEVLEKVIEQDSIERIKTPIIVKDKLEKGKEYISGKVLNSASGAVIEASINIVDGKGNVKGLIVSTSEEGFKFPVNSDLTIVSIQKFGYQPFIDTLILNQGKVELFLNPVKVGDKLVMHKIYFHPNTYVLKETSKKELEKLKDFVLENKDYTFEIQGHTNGNSTIKKNKRYSHLGEAWNFSGSAKKLSKFRADEVKKYLIKNGANDEQLITKGFGGDKMIVSKPKTMEQAMKNIRVEVVVVK